MIWVRGSPAANKHWHSLWDENTSRALFAQLTNVALCIWLKKKALCKSRPVLKHFHYQHRENIGETDEGGRGMDCLWQGLQAGFDPMLVHDIHFSSQSHSQRDSSHCVNWLTVKLPDHFAWGQQAKTTFEIWLHLFFAREDISVWQEISWKSGFLTSVIGTHTSETLSLKAWGGGIQWEFPAGGARHLYRARHNSQGVFEFEGHHYCSWMQQWWHLEKGWWNPGV